VTAPTRRSVNSTVAAVFGAVYALVGLAGFLVTDTFAGQEGDSLLGFQVNGLHNVVHLLIGLGLLAASRQLRTARSANLAIGGTYVALALLGPFITGTDLNVVALNGADHGLHAVSGLLLLAVGLAADKERVRA
jgi:hypothetical protein